MPLLNCQHHANVIRSPNNGNDEKLALRFVAKLSDGEVAAWNIAKDYIAADRLANLTFLKDHEGQIVTDVQTVATQHSQFPTLNRGGELYLNYEYYL